MEPLPNDPLPGRWAGLGTRAASAALLALLAFACIWRGGALYSALILLAALVMKKEWDALTEAQSSGARLSGYAYIILPCVSLLWLRSLPGQDGFDAVLMLVAVISATDIGAYFIGKRFGRHKLSPRISPGKSWEGLGGGVLAATLVILIFSSHIPTPHTAGQILLFAPSLALLAQAGDLFESSLKRRAGVKDSGTLLPGHGGLLDRFDGYMFASPVYALLLHHGYQSVAAG